MQPYMLRCTKRDALGFLPAVAQVVMPPSMTPLQLEMWRRFFSKKLDLIKAILANAKLTAVKLNHRHIVIQLRECACLPFIYNQAIEGSSYGPDEMLENLIAASSKQMLLRIMQPKMQNNGLASTRRLTAAVVPGLADHARQHAFNATRHPYSISRPATADVILALSTSISS